LLGNNGGNCKGKSDVEIIINSKITARIQEMHILIGHIICDLVENNKFIKNET
jgi:D-sedoheptulose 7-phosphate isomerase